MAMIPTLYTPRLVLRPLSLEDAPAIQSYFPRWEIVQYLNAKVPWPYPEDGALAFCRAQLSRMRQGGPWVWTLRHSSGPDHAIGCIDLRQGDQSNRGFWLGLPWHGQGLMSEACSAVTDFWFNVLGFDILRVEKAIDNAASRRISAKQGMRLVGIELRDFVKGRCEAEIWQISRAEWEARRARNT